jgi:CheY-like chemotaxis protein
MATLRVLTLDDEKVEFPDDLSELPLGDSSRIRLDHVQGHAAALRKLSETAFDAVLCVADRREQLAALPRLRKQSPATPIVLVTDSTESDLARWGRAFGATEVLPRGSSHAVVARTLQLVVEQSGLTRQGRAESNKARQLAQDITALAREANRLARDASRSPAARSALVDFNPVLVEDDFDHAFLMLRAFGKARVPGPSEWFRNGDEAIAYLSGQGEYADRRRHPEPSLVILDLGLPGKAGFDVLAWIRKQPRFDKLPVVVLSNSSDPEDHEKASALGASLFLLKPIGLDGLLDTVRAIAGYWAVSRGGIEPAR